MKSFLIHSSFTAVDTEVCEWEGGLTWFAPRSCSTIWARHLPRLQVAEPKAHAAVREAVLQGLQLGFREQEQWGQAFRLGQPHHCGWAVGVVQHHHLRGVVPEHHGNLHARGSIRLEASWHRVAPLKRLTTWLMCNKGNRLMKYENKLAKMEVAHKRQTLSDFYGHQLSQLSIWSS